MKNRYEYSNYLLYLQAIGKISCAHAGDKYVILAVKPLLSTAVGLHNINSCYLKNRFKHWL